MTKFDFMNTRFGVIISRPLDWLERLVQLSEWPTWLKFVFVLCPLLIPFYVVLVVGLLFYIFTTVAIVSLGVFVLEFLNSYKGKLGR